MAMEQGKVSLVAEEEDDESYKTIAEEDDESYKTIAEEDDESFTEGFWDKLWANSPGGILGGLMGGKVNLPNGRSAPVQFSQPLVTKEEHMRAISMIRGDVGRLRRTVVRNHRHVVSNDKRLSTG